MSVIYAIRSRSIFPEKSEPVWLCWHPDEWEEEQYTWEDEETFLRTIDEHPDWVDEFCFNSEAEAELFAEDIGIVDDYEVVAIK